MSDPYALETGQIDVFNVVFGVVEFVGKALLYIGLLCIAGTVFLVVSYTAVTYMALSLIAGALWGRAKKLLRFG